MENMDISCFEKSVYSDQQIRIHNIFYPACKYLLITGMLQLDNNKIQSMVKVMLMALRMANAPLNFDTSKKKWAEKLYGPAYKIVVVITLVSSARSDEPAYHCKTPQTLSRLAYIKYGSTSCLRPKIRPLTFSVMISPCCRARMVCRSVKMV